MDFKQCCRIKKAQIIAQSVPDDGLAAVLVELDRVRRKAEALHPQFLAVRLLMAGVGMATWIVAIAIAQAIYPAWWLVVWSSQPNEAFHLQTSTLGWCVAAAVYVMPIAAVIWLERRMYGNGWKLLLRYQGAAVRRELRPAALFGTVAWSGALVVAGLAMFGVGFHAAPGAILGVVAGIGLASGKPMVRFQAARRVGLATIAGGVLLTLAPVGFVVGLLAGIVLLVFSLLAAGALGFATAAGDGA